MVLNCVGIREMGVAIGGQTIFYSNRPEGGYQLVIIIIIIPECSALKYYLF